MFTISTRARTHTLTYVPIIPRLSMDRSRYLHLGSCTRNKYHNIFRIITISLCCHTWGLTTSPTDSHGSLPWIRSFSPFSKLNVIVVITIVTPVTLFRSECFIVIIHGWYQLFILIIWSRYQCFWFFWEFSL